MSDTGKLILPKPAVKSAASDDLAALKTKYDNLVEQFNLLLSALRISKLGV